MDPSRRIAPGTCTTMAAAAVDFTSSARGAALLVGDAAEGLLGDLVEHGLEVVEEDAVGGALEGEGHAPVRVDAGLHQVPEGDDDVGEDKGDGEEHAGQHDAEARVDLDELPQAEAVRPANRHDQLPGRVDPPRVPDQELKGPHPGVGPVAEVEVLKVGPRLRYPERLHGDEGDDEESAPPSGKERADLEPGDDIVDLV